jgi:hypothetical protein
MSSCVLRMSKCCKWMNRLRKTEQEMLGALEVNGKRRQGNLARQGLIRVRFQTVGSKTGTDP